jgi:hypothetical protein
MDTVGPQHVAENQNKHTEHFEFKYLDLNQVDGFHEAWFSCQNTCIEASPGSWDDLSTTTMNCISMQCYIMHIKSDTSHVLFTKDTL